MYERFPHFSVRIPIEPSHEEALHRAAARQAMAEQPRWKHPCVVDDENITAAEDLREIAKVVVADGAAGAIEEEESRAATCCRRLLGD
jgi:hypothetical protein